MKARDLKNIKPLVKIGHRKFYIQFNFNKITYEEVNNLSIKDILEIAPAEKAIKYLAEKGLNMEK